MNWMIVVGLICVSIPLFGIAVVVVNYAMEAWAEGDKSVAVILGGIVLVSAGMILLKAAEVSA